MGGTSAALSALYAFLFISIAVEAFGYHSSYFRRGGEGKSVIKGQKQSSTRQHASGASASELSISGGGGKDRDKDYQVQFPDDDFGMNEVEEELDEDALFEREMAKEMFDVLRGDDEELSVEDFMEWDDIKDVLEAGVIDAGTMALIVESIGVKKSMSFEQWLDTVELVNEVQLTLDGVDDSVQTWDPVLEQEKADALYGEDDEVDSTSESVKQMLRMFGLKPAGEEAE